MAVACICGSFGKPAAEHEHDCPVRRAWERGGGAADVTAAGIELERTVPPVCNCGVDLGTQPYRHARSCPVYRAWVGAERPEVGSLGFSIDRRDNSAPLFTVGQKCRTRDGRRARVLAVDLAGRQPIAAAISSLAGLETVVQFYANGRYANDEGFNWDLSPAPRRAVVWVNWYGPVFASEAYESFAEAEKGASRPGLLCERVARVKVEITEGRFDD